MERGAHSRAAFLEGLVTQRGTRAGAAHKKLESMGRTHIEEVGVGLSPMGGQGKNESLEVLRSVLGERRERKLEVKLSPERGM